MTNEEAVQTMELMKAEIEWEYPIDYQMAFDIAIEALKKQTEKKPIKNKGFINKSWSEEATLCPDCKSAQRMWR